MSRRAPQPPPKNKGGRPRRPPDLAHFEALGTPPVGDALETQRWVFKILALELAAIATDKTLGKRQRRAEMRSHARVLTALVPKARMREAENAIRGDQAELKADVNPALETAPDAAPMQASPPNGKPHA